MTRRRAIPLALVLLLLAALPASAGARGAAAKLRVGDIHLAVPEGAANALLVPVSYPIELDEGRARLTVTLRDGTQVLRRLRLSERLSSGERRVPDRRSRFTYVHRVAIGAGAAALARRGQLGVEVEASAKRDVDGDGRTDVRGGDRGISQVRPPRFLSAVCSSSPRLRIRPGAEVEVPLPTCDSTREWSLVSGVRHGKVTFHDGRLTYHAPPRFRGTQTIELVGMPDLHLPRARASGFHPLAFVDVPVTVGTARDVVVRALGDSVTAGFGYYDNGTLMTIGHLLECRPGKEPFNDACSSNSLNRSNKGSGVEYAADYGLANNVSWAAQWSNEHGIANYANFAISGSEPSDWAPGGEFHATTERIESEDPDYVLMTMGANPLLSEMLFGLDHMGCAIYAEVFGGYRECVEEAFAEVHLRENLESLYRDLVEHTDATIYLMQYHLSVPSIALAYSATQIAEMGKLLNREIAAIAAEVNPKRLQVVSPPHFDVGIDIAPVYPSRFTCSRRGYKVDGPSVQSEPTQDELEILHPFSFCDGPPQGPPWVISGDTGIHPSAAGYAQMASQVPAPGE
ncbi:MAG TPA: SGNH/GDSL hydrolase family protein [Solirubrobacterales bacterium]|nr:SGNH/GDSL hydrolase family protein [Solirubrobacterales bacterium]